VVGVEMHRPAINRVGGHWLIAAKTTVKIVGVERIGWGPRPAAARDAPLSTRDGSSWGRAAVPSGVVCSSGTMNTAHLLHHSRASCCIGTSSVTSPARMPEPSCAWAVPGVVPESSWSSCGRGTLMNTAVAAAGGGTLLWSCVPGPDSSPVRIAMSLMCSGLPWQASSMHLAHIAGSWCRNCRRVCSWNQEQKRSSSSQSYTVRRFTEARRAQSRMLPTLCGSRYARR